MPANRANPPEAEMPDFMREEPADAKVAPIESQRTSEQWAVVNMREKTDRDWQRTREARKRKRHDSWPMRLNST